jgi:hypothetical protein
MTAPFWDGRVALRIRDHVLGALGDSSGRSLRESGIRSRARSGPPVAKIAPQVGVAAPNIGYNDPSGRRPVMLWIIMGFVVAMMVGFLVPRKPLSLNLKPSSRPPAPDAKLGDPPADPKNGS